MNHCFQQISKTLLLGFSLHYFFYQCIDCARRNRPVLWSSFEACEFGEKQEMFIVIHVGNIFSVENNVLHCEEKTMIKIQLKLKLYCQLQSIIYYLVLSIAYYIEINTFPVRC